jgi:hypothetical protein
MKKYRFLKEGETIQYGDEGRIFDHRPFMPMEKENIGLEYDAKYWTIRRPIPFAGKVAFLVTYSPVIRVVVDTDGLDEEQIMAAAGEAARERFRNSVLDYIDAFYDNIDWEKTAEDTECPYVEPQYRFLEVGEKVLVGDLYEWRDKGWREVTETEYNAIPNHTVKEHEAGKFQRQI